MRLRRRQASVWGLAGVGWGWLGSVLHWQLLATFGVARAHHHHPPQFISLSLYICLPSICQSDTTLSSSQHLCFLVWLHLSPSSTLTHCQIVLSACNRLSSVSLPDLPVSTLLASDYPASTISWKSLTMILACPFLGSACPLPWLSSDYLIQLYRVSVTPISSAASCSYVTLIIPSLRKYETEFHGHYSSVSWFGLAEPNLHSPPETVKGQWPEDRLFYLLPVCYQRYLSVFVLALGPNQTHYIIWVTGNIKCISTNKNKTKVHSMVQNRIKTT